MMGLSMNGFTDRSKNFANWQWSGLVFRATANLCAVSAVSHNRGCDCAARANLSALDGSATPPVNPSGTTNVRVQLQSLAGVFAAASQIA